MISAQHTGISCISSTAGGFQADSHFPTGHNNNPLHSRAHPTDTYRLAGSTYFPGLQPIRQLHNKTKVHNHLFPAKGKQEGIKWVGYKYICAVLLAQHQLCRVMERIKSSKWTGELLSRLAGLCGKRIDLWMYLVSELAEVTFTMRAPVFLKSKSLMGYWLNVGRIFSVIFWFGWVATDKTLYWIIIFLRYR